MRAQSPGGPADPPQTRLKLPFCCLCQTMGPAKIVRKLKKSLPTLIVIDGRDVWLSVETESGSH